MTAELTAVVTRPNEARQECERLNVDDAASFLVELFRLGAVDEWERGCVAEVRAEGERRRHEHRREGGGAVSGMLVRGEAAAGIAERAGVKVSEVRAVLNAAGAQSVTPRDALGAASAARDAPAGDATRAVGVGGDCLT